MKLTTETFERPSDLRKSDDPKVLYARSYLLIRVIIGGVGVLLPTSLFLLDWLLLGGSASVRGSLSAYYHSAARDLFVAALAVTGFFLISYMAGQKSTWDYWLSTIAGVAALGVAFLPTNRPDLGIADPRCGQGVELPLGCTQLQHALGEQLAATMHYTFAGFFILSLAVICFVFAHREADHTDHTAQARLHRACGVAIIAAVGWIAVGDFFDLTIAGIEPLYIGEVVSVYAFGVSWLIKAQDLLGLVFKKDSPTPRSMSKA